MASTDKKSNVVLTQVAAYLMTVFPLCIYQGLLCCMACLCVKKKKKSGVREGTFDWLQYLNAYKTFFLLIVKVLINSFLLSLTQIVSIKSRLKKALIFEAF